MIKTIVEVPASEKYLKIYFFQLYSATLYCSGIEFDEDKVNSIIKSKSFEEMTSTELFDLCKIRRREWEEDFTSYLTEKFFFIQPKEGIEKHNVFDHPFLYTDIRPIVDDSIYEAQFGISCHLLNKHGEELLICEDERFKSSGMSVFNITPNLYDKGYYYFKVFSNELIELILYDENNGQASDLYQMKEETYFLKIHEIENKQTIQSIIHKNNDASIIKFASDDLQNDLELMSQCIRMDSTLLKYASEAIQNNFELVLEAVTKDGSSLEFASNELKDDEKIVLSAVQECAYAINFASEKLRNDKEIALIAIEKNYRCYNYLSKEIKDDPEIKNKILSMPKNNVTKNWNILDLNDDELNEDLDDYDLPF